MMLFISTSRKPGALTRKLSRWLGHFLGDCDNRGKSSLDALVERAEKKGYKRILLVYERNGNPAELVFYEDGWLSPSLEIRGVKWPAEEKRGRLPHAAAFEALDEQGGEVGKLFDLGEAEGEAVVIKASANELFFEKAGERVGPTLKVRVIEVGGGKAD